MDPLTYRAAGVDIQAGDEAVRRIARLAARTHRPEVLGGIGAFAAFCRIPSGYQEPVLVSSTDGVGSKLKVAFLADRHDTVGIDLVAMGVNDLLVHGAEPFYFLDYLAVHRVEPARVEAIVAGIAAGCVQAGCALVGGETAEMPDFYAPGEYDLAGFAVGVVERSRIITGAEVKPGDRVLGLASSGLHSNGYSLARRVVFERLGAQGRRRLPRPRAHAWPTSSSSPRASTSGPCSTCCARCPCGPWPTSPAAASPTTCPRVLPEGCRAVIRPSSWPLPPIFTVIQEAGRVDEDEMRRTFNMGIGYLVVVRAEDADPARALLSGAGEAVFEVGEIEAGAAAEVRYA